MISSSPFAVQPAAGLAHLRILETTDLHAHVFPYDYYSDQPSDTVGLARTATLVAAARAEAPNCLLFDIGDFLHGNPMGDFIAEAAAGPKIPPHPVIAAMNVLGYDAGTLGNHEFNFGLPFLMGALAGARFPLVCANLVQRPGAGPLDDTPLLPPHVLLDRVIVDGVGKRWPIRIGVIGFLPPQVMIWDQAHLDGKVVARDIVASAEAFAPRLRDLGCDLVVALCHSGIGPASRSTGMENAAIPLGRIPGIDVILAGHSHGVFPSAEFDGLPDVDVAAGTVSGKPAVMAGAWGSHLGLIDLLLAQKDAADGSPARDGSDPDATPARGRWRIVDHRSSVRAIAAQGPGGVVRPRVDSAPEVLAAAQAGHDASLVHIRRPVGRIAEPLHSFFALVRDDPSVRVVCAAQAWHVSRALAGTAYAGLPLLSAAAPFKTGGRAGPSFYTDIAPGNVALRNIADLYLYPNAIRAVKVTGAQLRDWLEHAAGLFNRIVPGQADQPLLNPDFPCYNFDTIAGLSYMIDLAQPPRFDVRGAVADPGANRIVGLAFAGTPVDPSAEFAVATNSYRAAGGGSFPGFADTGVILEGQDTIRDIVLRYLTQRGFVPGPADGGWRFLPMPGTTATFVSSPRAASHVGTTSGIRIEPDHRASQAAGPDGMAGHGVGAGGFARYRIRL